MKKKLKVMKRRWRKLHQMDRRFFRLIGAFSILYLLLLPLSITFLTNLVWMITLALLQYINICMRRNRQYAYYLRGEIHQIGCNRVATRRIMYENAELKHYNSRLNSDYKKLEYDYHQLKKSINPIKKKKK